MRRYEDSVSTDTRVLARHISPSSWGPVHFFSLSHQMPMISPGISLEGMMLKLKLQYFGHLMWRADSLEKTQMLGGIGGRRRRETEDEMAGWHRWLDGHESQWTPGVGDGQGGLACCDSWGRKELDTTERLNWTSHTGKVIEVSGHPTLGFPRKSWPSLY